MNERVEESWATREMGRIISGEWYGLAEEIVEQLAEEQSENPFVALAERLKERAMEILLQVTCPKEYCHRTFEIEGTANWIIVNFFLGQVHWDAITREYEDGLVREGGVKISDYEWEWEEADGGECDDD